MSVCSRYVGLDTSNVWTAPYVPSSRLSDPEQVEEHQVAERPTNTTATAGLKITQFTGLLRDYLVASCPAKHLARARVIDDLHVNQDLARRIDLLLAESLASPRAGRLDDAIDVLSDKRVDLVSYLFEMWSDASLQNLDADAIHVLLRAAGRRSDAAGFIVPEALRSERASVRESAVEALADIATESAIKELQIIAADGQECPSVREAAREYLAELRED